MPAPRDDLADQLGGGASWTRSSTSPSRNTRRRERERAARACAAGVPAGRRRPQRRSRRRDRATPPKSAVGRRCQRSARGAGTSPSRGGPRTSVGPAGVRRQRETPSAHRSRQPRPGVLAGIQCVPARPLRWSWRSRLSRMPSQRDGRLQPIGAWILVEVRDAARHVLEAVLVGLARRGRRRSRDDEPVSSRTRSASSRIVISSSLPMLNTWPTASGGRMSANERPHHVADVAEAARLLAVAVDRERLRRPAPGATKRRDDHAVLPGLARPDGVEQPRHDGRAARAPSSRRGPGTRRSPCEQA